MSEEMVDKAAKAIEEYERENAFSRPYVGASMVIKSLRHGAVARVLDDAENEGIAMHTDEAQRYVDAVLGLKSELETESDSPSESDIADLRYDAERAAEKDES